MSRRTKINLAWFAFVAVLFGVWAIRNILPIDAVNKPYEIQAEFASSLGMQPGNEVAYLGTKYGSVASVKRIAGGVLVTMKIDRDKRIPRGSTAHLFRKSAIGEQYVDFAPPPGYEGPGGPWIEPGARIGRDRTTVPLEFSELLRSASRLVEQIEPADVRSLVHELALGLDGRTNSLRTLNAAGDQLSRTLAARTEALDRLASNNTALTHVVTEHRGSLGQSLTDLRQVADSLEKAKGDVAVLLDRGRALLDQVAPIVAANKGNLDCVLGDLEAVLDASTTPERLAGLRTLLQQGGDGFGRLWDVRDVDAVGRTWVRVGFLANTENKAPQYVPPNTMGPPTSVPACASPLKPADYVTLAARNASSTRDADGRRGALVGLGLALLAGAAVARETRRLRSGA